MDEYKKMFESVERDFGNGSGKIPLIKLYNIMSTMPEFDKDELTDRLKALSVYIKIDTKHSVDSIENSFESVEDWLIKINFEKFLEFIEKSLILQFFQYVHSVRGQSGFYDLALTERNMQIRFNLKLCVYSLGVDI